jgi:hypothetical protein
MKLLLFSLSDNYQKNTSSNETIYNLPKTRKHRFTKADAGGEVKNGAHS